LCSAHLDKTTAEQLGKMMIQARSREFDGHSNGEARATNDLKKFLPSSVSLSGLLIALSILPGTGHFFSAENN
jgi:hypothetical protein